MIDLSAEAEEIVARYPEGKQRSALVPLLHLVQERDGYVTKEAMEEVAGLIGLAPAEVRGVASFYVMLHLEPKGRHVISVCHNIACTMAGAEPLIAALEHRLGVPAGETTDDREFTLERAECLAACDQAPMIQIDYDRMVGPLSPSQAEKLIDEIRGVTPELPHRKLPSEKMAEDREPMRITDEPAPLIDSIRLTEAERALLHPEVRRIHEPAPEGAEEAEEPNA